MPDVISNGIRIHYERSGGDKPPVVLCHGITDSGQCWPRLVSALQDSYDLIMLDARAHGRSEAPASGYTIENMADDVAGVILVLGLHKPAVIGHSMGAGTVAMLAARHPNLPGCMVLEDPPFREGVATDAQRAAMAAEWQKSVTDRVGLPLDQMIEYSTKSNPGVKKWDKAEFGPWSEAKRRVNLNIIQLVRNSTWAYRSVVPAITCPTLLITADPAKGGMVTAETAQAITMLNPTFKVVHIPDAGHNVRRESFATYLAAVTAFLSSVPR